MPTALVLPQAAFSTNVASATAVQPSAPTGVGGAINNFFTSAINSASNIAPGLLNAFVISRAARDSGINNVLQASQTPVTTLQQDAVPQGTTPPTAGDLGNALNGSGGSAGITPQHLVLGGGALLLLVAALR